MSAAPTHNRIANAYLQTRVMSASPEELRLMLLDGAIKFAIQGRDGITSKDYNAVFAGLNSARDIVLELLTTIREDVNPELAANAKALYTFIYRQLVDGGYDKDLTKLNSAIELLQFERETWVMLMQQLASERGQTAATDSLAAFSTQG